MNDYSAQVNMISQQIRTWGVNDQRVLDAFFDTPRESFVPDEYKSSAYGDFNIPLDGGEYMMSPMIEARILDELKLQPNESVFEIGTGSGFLTALIAKLAGSVFSMDIHGSLITRARYRLKAQGIFNVKLKTGNALKFLDDDQTFYDVIILTGSIPEIPDYIEQRLTIGGRLFAVIGKNDATIMEATMIKRNGESDFQTTKLFETSVPQLHEVTQPRTFTF
ncbi:protein-L-isoaspartate O-methyltransferase [Thiotrichales bacterium 19S11-10]|nr:protein-L-isoaspartate O-methyltransferase [Thiotrichales bacterium 19S11-10]